MAATGMMRQYEQAKEASGDALLLFRMGDFYELFHDDAKTAARVLDLTLTTRDKHKENPIPMAGFPHHQLEGYLAKLIADGFRAAVCDQVEDPKQAKGLVRREITRVVTAGTLVDDALLDPRQANHLMALVPGDPAGVAWVELSTGQFHAANVPAGSLDDELARVGPSECLLADDQIEAECAANEQTVWTGRPPWEFALDEAIQSLTRHFRTNTLEGFGFHADQDAPAIRAAGAILRYLQETQKSSLAHVDRLLPYRVGTALQMDESTRRSLEITQTMREGRREGSLLSVLDQTVTSMGSRLLHQRVANPLVDVAEIDSRLDAIDQLLGNPRLGPSLHEALRGVYDLERLLARVSTGRASPRDLQFIGQTLVAVPSIQSLLSDIPEGMLIELSSAIDPCDDLRDRLNSAIEEGCPLSSRDGGFIRDGFDRRLDELREMASGGKQWIAQYQAEEIERTGIPNLKIGFNKVFGYYLEVTHAQRDKVPDTYIRKQTIKHSERFVTPELKEYEDKVISADEKAKDLEYDLFVGLRDEVAGALSRLQTTARTLAQVDVLVTLAKVAHARNYCRPKLVEESQLEIIDGRHPVLDVTEASGTFVPNDTVADDRPILLITGPNMAGKSTYIRQVALLTLMAQMGSYVPASRATIGVADRIFARVGASDELARGQSTFMVEMLESARILNTATHRSLVILDEVGRGTSTYDGLSLAWSVVEYLHDTIACRTLFATHYHELTDLEHSLAGVRNLNVAVREWDDQVVFLHKIVDGAADKSYGIHVARLAGIPDEVNQRAKQILAQLEDDHLDAQGRAKIARPESGSRELQLTLFGPQDHPLLDTIRAVDANAITPIQALQMIQQWQSELADETVSAKR